MNELIKLQLLEEDAIRVASSNLDPHTAIQAWPPHVHHEWLNIYYRQVERNERDRQDAHEENMERTYTSQLICITVLALAFVGLGATVIVTTIGG